EHLVHLPDVTVRNCNDQAKAGETARYGFERNHRFAPPVTSPPRRSKCPLCCAATSTAAGFSERKPERQLQLPVDDGGAADHTIACVAHGVGGFGELRVVHGVVGLGAEL